MVLAVIGSDAELVEGMANGPRAALGQAQDHHLDAFAALLRAAPRHLGEEVPPIAMLRQPQGSLEELLSNGSS